MFLSARIVKRHLGIVLFGTALVVSDVPARITAPLGDQENIFAAFADDDDGGSDSSDSDADDSDDSDTDEDDTDADDVDRDDHLTGRSGDGYRIHRSPGPAQRPVLRALRVKREIVAAGLDEQTLAELTAAGYIIVHRERLGSIGETMVRLRVPRGTTLATARRHLASKASAIDYNHYYRPEQEDPRACPHADCYAAELVRWPPPKETATCGNGVRIGLIDTGINAKHAMLDGLNLEIIPLERTTKLPGSRKQHGTAVASLLLGPADRKSPGLLPGSTVIAIDSFHLTKAGDERTDVFDLVRALDILSQHNVQAVNMSLSGPPNKLLEQVIAKMVAKNIVLVAAAGNKGARSAPLYPAAYAGVMAVTAVDHRKTIYRHANQGEYIDFAAPGVNVWTAAPVTGARGRTGTSFAAPFVTAVAAVLAVNNPTMPPAAIQDMMASNAEDLGKPGKDPVYGWGLINARYICSAQTTRTVN